MASQNDVKELISRLRNVSSECRDLRVAIESMEFSLNEFEAASTACGGLKALRNSAIDITRTLHSLVKE